MRKSVVVIAAFVAVLLSNGCGNTTIGNLPLVITPSSATVSTGQTQQFQITVDGTFYNTDITWEVNGIANGNSSIGTISATGLYTAPSTVPNPANVTVTASQQGTNNQGNEVAASISAQITIVGNGGGGGGGGGGSTPSATINVSPSSIAPGQNATLSWSSANVSNCTINNETSINGDSVGLSGSVQVSPAATTTYDLNCTGSNGNASNSTTLTVQVTNSGISVMLTPSTATLASGKSMQFTAVVSNDASGQGVVWSATIGNPPAPSFANPLIATFTAPIVTANTAVTIRATSITDPSASATATVTITPQQTNGGACTGNGAGSPFVSVSPDTPPTIPFGGSQLLTATVMASGVTDNSVTWVLQPAEGVANPGMLTPQSSNTALYQATGITTFTTVRVVANSVQCPGVTGAATLQIGNQ